MNDRSIYQTHGDLLAQVAASEAENREVRRVLSKRVTDAELTRINADRLSAVECAVAAHKRSPWPYAPANSAHRHSPGCLRCESGLTQCTTPEACERADDTRPAVLSKLANFIAVYRLYRREHPRVYAARIAYGISFKGYPF